MLGLLLIYFIGKRFYELSERFNKSKWGYTIAGIAMYYLGTFLAAIGILFLTMNAGNYDFVEENTFLTNIISIPFGLMLCAGFYKLLEVRFKKQLVQTKNHRPDILDDMI